MEPPIFAPLSNHLRAIRVVRIDGLDEYGYLNLVTRNTNLDVEDHFVAVSYVWGTQDPTYTVILNGKHHYLRPNIWSFLVAAHEAKLEQDLWIDSLCINQSDNRERNQQIPLMGDIFTSARQVIGWLHDTVVADRDPASFEIVKTVSEGSAIQFDVMEPAMKLALLRLINNEYWSRLWIVQELELCPEIAIIWWHGHKIQWDKLKQFVSQTYDHLMRPDNRLDLKAKENTVGVSKQSFPIFDFCIEEQLNVSPRLIDVIIRYANHACSVNHDRVFGLLAFTPEARNFKALYEESHISLMARVLHVSTQFPTEDEVQKLGQLLSIQPGDIKIEAVEKIRLTSLNRSPEQIDLILGHIPGAQLYMVLGSSSELRTKLGSSARGDELGFLCFVDRIVGSDSVVAVRSVSSINDLQENNKLRFHNQWNDGSVHVTASWSSLYILLSEHFYWQAAAKSSSGNSAQVTLDTVFETLMDRKFNDIYVQSVHPLDHFPEVPASVYRHPTYQRNKWSIT